MSLQYKTDVLAALRAAGFSSYKLIHGGLLSASTVQKLREGKPISWENIERICSLLNCQPADILEYVPDSDQ